MTTTFQMRIDSGTKNRAQKAFRKAGLSFSSGMRIYLNSVARNEKLPLQMVTDNGYTVAEELEMLDGLEEAIKNGKRYKNATQLFKNLLK